MGKRGSKMNFNAKPDAKWYKVSLNTMSEFFVLFFNDAPYFFKYSDTVYLLQAITSLSFIFVY